MVQYDTILKNTVIWLNESYGPMNDAVVYLRWLTAMDY